MSHYASIQTEIRDPECLLKALADLGYADVELGQALPLYDYEGKRRPQRAEVVIRRRHIDRASNDVGFALQADGTFTGIVSDYDHSFGFQWNANRGKLLQRYGYHKAVKQAAAAGLVITGQRVAQDGTIHLVAQRRPGAVLRVGRR